MLAQRSVVRTLRQPAMVFPSLFFPLLLLVDQQQRPDQRHAPARASRPTPTSSSRSRSRSSRARSSPPRAPGTNVANDIETGFLNRLALTPLRRVALMLGPARRHPRARADPGGHVPARRASSFGDGLAAGPGGVPVVIVVLSLTDLARVRLHRRVRRAPDRHGRGGAGRVPALLRRAVPVVDVAAAQPDRDRLVPDGRHLQPGLVHARGDPLAVHHRAGTARRWRSASRAPAGVAAIAIVGLRPSALRTRMVRT